MDAGAQGGRAIGGDGRGGRGGGGAANQDAISVDRNRVPRDGVGDCDLKRLCNSAVVEVGDGIGARDARIGGGGKRRLRGGGGNRDIEGTNRGRRSGIAGRIRDL